MKKMKTDLIHFGYKNLNGRIYTKDSYDFNLLKERVNKKIIYGELGFGNSSDIVLSNVSHRITDVSIEGDCLMGEIEILDTHYGKLLQVLVKNNLIAFRSRGFGTVDINSFVKLEKLITFDAIPIEEDSYKDVINEIQFRKVKILQILKNIEELNEN